MLYSENSNNKKNFPTKVISEGGLYRSPSDDVCNDVDVDDVVIV